ncbi:motility associated factor glycosyltransferase family protein [Campylobacter vicugnae]|uniref:motility associated factor glycosyltransferase family protein n=1 Tax=Campylobacter vicugnae TaxID=1660076 RepID=UPI0015D7DCE1|nr:6-hydroxymethylpterin diphosphokinase MptE-like protein [Campylobacter sp. RM8970]
MQNYDKDLEAQAFEEFQRELEARFKAEGTPSNFMKNIVALSAINFRLAKAVYDLKSNTKFDVFAGKTNLDINIINTELNEPIYTNAPAEHTQAMIDKFSDEYALYPSLFFFGLGNGNFYTKLLQNQTHEKIIVFEPEIEIIFIAFNLCDFGADIFHERFVVVHPDYYRDGHIELICHYDAVASNIRNYNFHIYSNYYAKNYGQIAQKINNKIIESSSKMVLNMGNDAPDNLLGIKHVVANMPHIYNGYQLKDIIDLNIGKNKTAIIASTGPSLNKQIELLKKVAPHALILIPDASYHVLKINGIKPDFVATMERVEKTSEFFQSEPSQFDDGIMFMAASLTHPKTALNLKDRNRCYAHRPIRFEFILKDDIPFMCKGPSSAHFALDMALRLKCERIIFIGQDLAFAKDGSSHAKGNIFENYIKEDGTITINPNARQRPQTAIAYGGEGEVKTTDVWNFFRGYFESMMEPAHYDYKFKVYNATEGGARIHGTIEKPFSELVDEILAENSIKEIIKPMPINPQNAKDQIKRQKELVEDLIRYGVEKQRLCEELFKKISKAVENANKEIERGKEPYYPKFYELKERIDRFKNNLKNDEVFDRVYYHVANNFCVHQEMEFGELMVRPERTKSDKDKKIFEYVRQHGYYFFSLAGMMEATRDTMNESLQSWDEEFKL